MNDPVWLTKNADLGTIFEGRFFEFQLNAISLTTSDPVTYKVVAGKLPVGISLNQQTGRIHGVPDVIDPQINQTQYEFPFTVRATNSIGGVADKTFQITINGLVPPVITPVSRHLGQTLYSDYFYFDLNVVDPSASHKFTWRVVSGRLPRGLKLNTRTGEIEGYLIPKDRSGETEYTALNHRGSWDGLGFDMTPWSPSVRGIDPDDLITRYTFDIEVFDGVNTDRERYTLDVILREQYLASTTLITADTDIILTSVDSKYRPIITTTSSTIIARQDTDFIFKVEAIDYNNDEIRFAIHEEGVSSFLPLGVSVDPITGWITGRIGSQIEDKKEYTFTVYAYKRDDPSFKSRFINFTILVLGDYNYYIDWESPENLGSIFNGGISEFKIVATTPADETIRFELLTLGGLPRGLSLLDNGLIAGQVGFGYEADEEFEFSVRAIVPGDNPGDPPKLSSTKTFRINVVARYTKPYENIYIKALLPEKQRSAMYQIVNSQEIFPSSFIYRENDYNFGRYKDSKFLFLPGLEPSRAATYAEAVSQHHYNKQIRFSDIKTAIAVDEDFNIKYEVVYIEIKDEAEGNGPMQTLGKTITSTNPYYKNGNEYRALYPNSLLAMQKRVIDEVGFSYKGALPDWMTSRQRDGTVLGLVNAVVLAYTIPGAAEKIAYRIKTTDTPLMKGLFDSMSFDSTPLDSSFVDFTRINFVVDRYQLQNHLSNAWDIDSRVFNDVSIETTYIQNDSNDKYVKFPQGNIFVQGSI